MIENKKKLNRERPTWVTGIQLFSEISGWIVMPIVVALISGKALDNHFHTKPWIFLSLALFGFILTITGIVQIVKKYTEKLKKDGK